MKYVAIALLLGGCATTRDVDNLRTQFGNQSVRLDETRYHLQIESCRSTALLCGLVSKDEGVCVQNFAACVSLALETFRSRYGKDPSDLFDEPKRAR